MNTYYDEEMTFIGQRSGDIFDEISKYTISEIKYPKLLQNSAKLGWNILWPSAITKTEKNWVILARLGDIKQISRQNLTKMVFSWG